MNPGTKAVLINFGFTLLGAGIGLGTARYFYHRANVKILRDHRKETIEHLQQELKDNTSEELFSMRALGELTNYPFPPLKTSALEKFVEDFGILKLEDASLKEDCSTLKTSVKTFNDHVSQLNLETGVLAVLASNREMSVDEKRRMEKYQEFVHNTYENIMKPQMLSLLDYLTRNHTCLIKKGTPTIRKPQS